MLINKWLKTLKNNKLHNKMYKEPYFNFNSIKINNTLKFNQKKINNNNNN